MFKRIEKRQRKKEEEEALGLDEEVKEILGIQDTDSEESESDSDESQGGESAADEEIMDAGEDEEDNDSGEEEEEEDPSITVGQALKDPLYVVSILPDVKACIVCPGKLLKNVQMVQLHRTSNAHIRRFKQFTEDSADANPNDNAWDILKRNSETKPKLSLTTSGVSKRAEKKKASQVRRKARREEAKEKAKAKKAKAKATLDSTPAQPSDTPASTKLTSPPNKKRKIDMGPQVPPSVKISTAAVPSGPPPVSKKDNKKERAKTRVTESATVALGDDDNARAPRNIQDSVKIQDIVKSTSNRAKTARSQAMNKSKKHKLSD